MRRVQARALLMFGAIVYACCLTGSAQESSSDAEVRALSGRLLRTLARAQSADPATAEALQSEGAAIIEQRARALARLATHDPATALQFAFSSDLTTRLATAFPASASQLETRGVWEGTLEYIIEDSPDFSTHRNIRTIAAGGRVLSAEFAGSEPEGLKNGDLVRLTGIRVGDVLAVSDGTIVAPALDGPLTCSTTGQQNSIVLLVTMPGVPGPADITTNNVADTFFSPSQRSLSEYWREGSFGSTWAAGDVRGWYTLDRVYTCDETPAIRTAAIAAADADVDFTQYTRVFIIVNGATGTCTWGGLGTLACGSLTSADGSFTASTSWLRPGYFDPDDLLRDGVQIAAHEGGHNIGLRHSNSRDFGNISLGAMGQAGVVTEYGDLFSAMGRLRNNSYPEEWIGFGHYTAPQKLQLGWLSAAQVPVVTSSTSWIVEPLELAGSVQALKIVRGTQKVRGVTTTHSIWVEFRQPVGNYDTTLYSHVFTGALLHYEDSTNGGASHLLDLTPNVLIPESTRDPQVAEWLNAALAGTWTDGYTGIRLTTSNATTSGLFVDVVFGPVTCVLADPTVMISPSNPTALVGGSVTYTVSVTNNDSPACANRTFALSSSLPEGWNTTFSATSVTLAPTASSSVTMTKTVPAAAVEDVYAVDATATAATDSSTGSANCTVAPSLPPMVAKLSALGNFPKNSTVPIVATVTRLDSSTVPGASVLFTVTPPTGAPTTKTVVTDAAGQAIWNYKVAQKAPSGSYVVTAQATFGAESTAPVSEDFNVQ